MKHDFRLGLALLCLAAAAGVRAQPPAVEVRDAWVRPAYGLPSGTGVYMTLGARRPMRLTGAGSDAAGTTRLGGSSLADGVTTMHALAGGIALPAGKAVVLAPGGDYIDLDGLKRPLVVGDRVRIRLWFADAVGGVGEQEVYAPVRVSAPGEALPGGHVHMPMR